MIRRRYALALGGTLSLAIACGGETRAEADPSPDAPTTGGGGAAAGAAATNGGTDGAAVGGAPAGSGGIAAGGSPLTDCGTEGEGCCPSPSSSLILIDPCRDPWLQCCAGVCRLVCAAPDEPADAWAARPECDLSPHKACTADADCTLLDQRVNCCGTTRRVGIAVAAVTAVAALAATCEPTTTCDCPALELAEDGAIDPAATAEPTARCREGACTSLPPPVR